MRLLIASIVTKLVERSLGSSDADTLRCKSQSLDEKKDKHRLMVGLVGEGDEGTGETGDEVDGSGEVGEEVG